MRSKHLLLMLLLALMAPWAVAQKALPYSYGFEYTSGTAAEALAAEGWSSTTTNSNSGIYSAGTSSAHEGSEVFRFNYNENGTCLISPKLTSATNGVDVLFYYKASSGTWEETFQVGYTTEETATGFTYDPEITTPDGSTAWQEYSRTFPAGTTYIAIKYVYTNAMYLWLDDFSFTAPAACPKPTGLAVSSVTDNSAVISWTSTGDTWQIGYTPEGGTEQLVDNITDNPYTLTGLDPQTTYEVRVQNNCGGGTYSVFTDFLSFTTTAVATPVGDSWSDDFEGTSCDWQLINGEITNAWAHGTAAHTGTGSTKALYISNNGGTTNAYTINSPAMVFATKLLGFTEGKFEFSYNWIANGEGGSDYLRVALAPASVNLTAGTSTPSGFGSTALPSGWIALDGGSKLNLVSEWQNKTVAVNVPAGNYYLVLAWRNDGSIGTQPPAAVDNVSITKIACDYNVEGLAVSNITTNSADIAWTDSEVGEWQVAIKVGTDDWEIFPTTFSNNSGTLTLLAGTSYQVKVRAYCNPTDQGSWCEPVSFTTPCEATPALSFGTENFDGITNLVNNVLPDCWSYINTTTNSTYAAYPRISNSNSHSTSNCLRLLSYDYYYTDYDPQDQYAILPPMTGLAGKQITLWARGYDASSTFHVGLMTNPTDVTTFTELTNTDNPSLSTTYQEFTFFVPSNAIAQYVAIMIEAAEDWSYGTYNGVYVDDITISDIPTCFQPQNLTASNVEARTATLTWEKHSMGTETAWVLQIATNNTFTEGFQEFEVSTTPTKNLTNLTPETHYYARVKPACDTEGQLWSEVEDFTTLATCPAPTIFAVAPNGLTNHTAKLAWTGTSESYNVSYRTKAYTEGISEEFATSSAPTDWTRYSGALNDDGTGPTSAITSGWYFGTNYFSSSHAYMNVYSTNKFWLVTPSITVGAGYNMSFDVAYTAYNSTSAAATTGTDDRFCVLVSTDEKAHWTILREWNNVGTGDAVLNDIPATFQTINDIDISSYSGQTVCFAFYGASTTSNADNTLRIDNVNIGTPVPAGEWQNVTGIEANNVTLQNLLASRKYEAKLQGNCGDEGMSTEVGPITFITDIACPAPTGLAASNLKSTQVDLSWTNGGSSDWVVAYKESSSTGNFTEISLDSDDVTINEGVVTYQLTGLEPEHTYTVKVLDNCEASVSGDGQSAWTSTIEFTTTATCAIDNVTVNNIGHYTATVNWDGESNNGFTVKYRTAASIDGLSEEFATTSAPKDWTRYSGALNDDGTGPTSTYSGGWSFGTNEFSSIHAYMNVYSTNKFWLVTPSIELGSGSTMSFDVAYTAYNSTSAAATTGTDDRFCVLVSTDEKAHWTILREWNNAGTGDAVLNDIPATFQTINDIDISSYSGQTVYFAFYGASTTSNADNTLRIDNVNIGTPVPAGGWQTNNVTESPANLTGLTAGTKYDLTVVPNCDEMLASEIQQFTTVSPNQKWFITEGNWGTPANWEPEGAPTIEQDVVLKANATITGEAYAKSIAGTGTGDNAKTLTIESGAKLKHLNSGVRATVKKTITGYGAGHENDKADYYLISNPLNTTITTTSTPAISTTGLLTGNYDFYNWDYSASDGNEWRNYEKNAFDFDYGLYGYLYANEATTTLTFTGTINPYTSNKYRSLTASTSETQDFPGWYLLGNPYMYDAYLVNSYSNGTALPYVKMNADGDGFENVPAGTPIEPMTGFFYQATSSAYVYIHTTAPAVTDAGLLNMNLRSGNKQLDNAIVAFGSEQKLEKFSFRANSSKIYMPVEGKDYAITNAEPQGEMPVSFKAENNGSYTLSFNTENVEFGYLHLIDNMTGMDVDLLQNPSYSFEAKTTDYASRFKLVFSTGNGVNEESFAFISDGNIILNGEGMLQVIDVMGRIMMQEENATSVSTSGMTPGVYVLRLINGDSVRTQKIVIK